MPMFKRQAAVLLALTALALGVVFYLWPDGDSQKLAGKPVPVVDKDALPSTKARSAGTRESGGSKAGKTGEESVQLTPGGKLIVFVSGAVKQPGVFELNSGSRVEDAVKAAGGFGALADVQGLNLAQTVRDGEEIKVPRRPEGVQVATGGVAGKAVNSAAGNGDMVHINSASAAELESLPGIGPALAGRIVEYRSRHGAFQRIEDIQEVPGIGVGRFERMKDRLAL